jgi:hypothetical protein
MKTRTLPILILTMGLLLAATSAFANDCGQNKENPGQAPCGAPAPLLGLGLPALLAVGGVLLTSRLFKRK